MKVTINTNVAAIHSFARGLDELLDIAVRETAEEVAQTMRETAPVDTAALSQSFYWVTATAGQGSRAKAVAAAKALNPKAKFTRPRLPKRRHEAFVESAVTYAKYVNATHPTAKFFMEKAKRQHTPTFRNKVRRALSAARPR